LAKGNLADEVKKLKDQPGKDIIVYGGTSFVSALIREKLIDELTLFVNPVALGKGESIFSGLDDFQQFTLAETHVCKSGIIVLKYIPK
jgi:dihydrofolate reductase